MPNIHDVAKRAGVAPITVSRVVNNSGYVGKETRKRVEAAIKELGYVPNALARGLRSNRTNTLALVISDITNPFFTMLARGVEDAASAAGYTVIFCNTDESETKEEKYTRILVEKQVDGVLLIPASSSPDSVDFFQSRQVQVVLLDRGIPNVKTDLVRCDSEGGAYRLTKRLIELGHKHISIITGPQGLSISEDRVAGYRQALSEATLANNECIYYGPLTQASGYGLATQAIAQTPAPTALFGANNFISIGILKALRDAKMRVPQDISVVGFDDLPTALVVEPFLTVVAQPAYEMGRKATELLLSRLSKKTAAAFQEIILPTEIIERQSSGTPPA
ncbi:MAG: LacI family transcriptional regulator [Chloroflexi bacterium]|nr:MAG: LacI family transcriptional regulator [Chloroflexota bacterium]